MRHVLSSACLLTCLVFAIPASAQDAGRVENRVLATNKTSTMEKEMNQAADAGFRFAAVNGGETAVGGKEVVVVMSRAQRGGDRFQYKLLATSKTSTMQRELSAASEAGYEYRGQTVFESTFGGREVVCILEKNVDHRTASNVSYKLLATSRTSTMEKELQQAGADGYEVVGLTVAETAIGGRELVAILRRGK